MTSASDAQDIRTQIVNKDTTTLPHNAPDTTERVFIAGRDGVGFHTPDPALTRDKGGIFQVIPTPPPSRAHPHLFPGHGPLSYYLFLTGTHLG